MAITLKHYHILYCNVLLHKTKSLFARSFVVYMKCECVWRGYGSQKRKKERWLLWINYVKTLHRCLSLRLCAFHCFSHPALFQFILRDFPKRIELIEIPYELPVDRFSFAKTCAKVESVSVVQLFVSIKTIILMLKKSERDCGRMSAYQTGTKTQKTSNGKTFMKKKRSIILKIVSYC